MDVLKTRNRSQLLEGLDILNSRMKLSTDVDNYYRALKAGFEGELAFDQMFSEGVTSGGIVLNDLLLSVNGSTIQIDSLILAPDIIYLFEIKNYRGNYRYDNDHYRKTNGYDILNPKNQLNKTLTLLSQLLKQWKVATPLKGAVVFVHQTFTLYEAQPDEQVVLPSQLISHLKLLNSQHNKVPQQVRSLANRLIEHHRDEVPYQKQLPDFHWDKLKKGLTCGSCKSFDLKLNQRSCVCLNCERATSRKNCLIENINNLILLYPDKKVTTSLVYEWIGERIYKRSISIVLEESFIKEGAGRGRYYR
ncbi:MAG: NERD domain-containing protein [Alkalibacterium sp.]|nr:NERD domain-containing protein [Alkalibacterium sp.]